MADAGIAIWESKYYYDFWRPVTGIREADAGTGPTGQGDGNPATIGDPEFSPLGAPASNLERTQLHTAFPRLSLRACGLWRSAFSRPCAASIVNDRIAFTFVSDEFNGVNARHRTETCGHSFRATLILCQKPKRKTARVESISAFTGRSTRAKEFPKAGTLRITCLPTFLHRCSRRSAGHGERKSMVLSY